MDNLRFPWILTVSGVKLLGINGVYGRGVIIGLGIGNRCLNIALTEKSYKRINC